MKGPLILYFDTFLLCLVLVLVLVEFTGAVAGPNLRLLQLIFCTFQFWCHGDAVDEMQVNCFCPPLTNIASLITCSCNILYHKISEFFLG